MPLALAALLLVLGVGGHRADAAEKLEQRSTINRVAHRVEQIRGLKYKRIPNVKVVSTEELEQEQTAESAKLSARERADAQRAQQNSAAGLEAYKLLGVLPRKFDPNALGGGGSGGGPSDLLGIYDPKTNSVRLIHDAIVRHPKLAEATLAHELDHALEFQNFPDRSEGLDPVGERASAYQSLEEGAATVVEYQYAKRYLGAEKPLRDFLDRDTFVGDSPRLPQALKDAVAFPYRQGGLFVDALLNQAGNNSFRLVDEAQKRPPQSTAEILHPDLWRGHQTPLPVRLRAGDVLHREGWKRLGGTDFGEFDTAALLRVAGSRSQGSEAAEGWAGGAFELWRQGAPTQSCKQPCHSREVLVIGWRWRSASDAAQEAARMQQYLKHLHASETGDGVWKLGDGYAAFSGTTSRSVLVLAPTAGLAKELRAGAF